MGGGEGARMGREGWTEGWVVRVVLVVRREDDGPAGGGGFER
jgi:hypothetical protein